MSKSALRSLREKRGMRVQEVADAAGITRSGYANIELGIRAGRVATIQRIYKVLDADWRQHYDDQPTQKGD